MNYLNKVAEFHKTFKAPILDRPQLIERERAALRIRLIQEELDELKEAVENDDLIEVADALADLQYVLSGAVLEFGMKKVFDEMFKEVHRSNMSKVCKNYDEAIATQAYYLTNRAIESTHEELENKGYLVFRKSDMKVLKSINYSPADLSSILKPHCSQCLSHYPQEDLQEYGGICESCYDFNINE